MKRFVALAIILGLLLWPACSSKSSHKKDGEDGDDDDDVEYTIERRVNVDYRGWAKLELAEGEQPKARLTFHGSLDPYFSDELEVEGEGVVTEFPERDITMFDITFSGAKLENSGCEDELNYRFILLEGGTLDVSRGALAVFCGEPTVGEELHIYRLSSRGDAR